jgi:hypothetical protein
VPTEERVLVVPGGSSLQLVDGDGATVWSTTLDGTLGSCAECDAEGASIDGDGLLLAFTTSHGAPFPGGIARLDVDLTLDLRLDGFDFPHDVVRDPADGTLIVAETTADALTWVPGDGSSSAALRSLDAGDGLTPLPNGLERLDFEGRTFLVVTHRGNVTPPGAGAPLGSITLWEVSDPLAPALVWRFPAAGALETPHGAAIRYDGAQWWLLYAHTGGAVDSTGTVGIASMAVPTDPPSYVADLTVPAALAPLVFLRGVERDAGGPLILVDSGLDDQFAGRLIRADFPDLAPSGASGGAGVDQVFVELTGAAELQGGMDSPFEAFWWTPPAAR